MIFQLHRRIYSQNQRQTTIGPRVDDHPKPGEGREVGNPPLPASNGTLLSVLAVQMVAVPTNLM